MKIHRRWLLSWAAVVFLTLTVHTVKATPYASGITVTNGTVQFFLNEDGANVTVTFEDRSTNASFNGQTSGLNLTKGAYTFSLGTHTGYAISVSKLGDGIPFQISNDSSNFAIWPGNTVGGARGVTANRNPQFGNLFGRIYAGYSGTAGGSGATARYPGIYAMNADLSDALGQGTNAFGGGLIGGEDNASAPYKLRVAPDNTLLEEDFSGNGALWDFAPDLSVSNAIFLQSQPAGIHGDGVGTPDMLINGNNVTLWIFDSGMGAPGSATLGPNTVAGDANNAFRYDIGTSSYFTYNNPPNYAFCFGLGSIPELHTEGDIGVDGKIICGFERDNLSNPVIQILSADGSTILWTSWVDTGGATDPWWGYQTPPGSPTGPAWAGVRESPDGRFLTSVDIDNGITLANMTNGLPDDASLSFIQNAPNVGDSRGMDWDAADNIYTISSGQGLLRVFSLGMTTTCITSNDITGTNGTFQLILPPTTASVVATTNVASQNYINNSSPGTPIPGTFTISLNSSKLTAPVVVNFSLSGTAALGTNYTIATGTDVNGVIVTTTNVTFPAGTFLGSGNWSGNVQVVPTATPVSGPTLTVDILLIGGANYLAATPETAIISIMNTGPQLLLLTPASFGTTMSRNVTNDYAQFVITRWGDLNGPGNSPNSINQRNYTVTNFTYSGTAVFPGDYASQAQGLQWPLQNGSPGIIVSSGVVTSTNAVGNPVRHSNLSAPPKDVTIVLSLTNSLTGTNATSLEGYSYSVQPATVTLTELDNAVGPEVVRWSDPLILPSDSTNWTLTFSATNMTAYPVLPVLLPNYTNDETAKFKGGTNDFRVEFGNPIAGDSIPQSQAMAQNGWTSALRMTVNKDGGNSTAAVNLFPQGMSFAGNYALRFNMYLSLYNGAINNPFDGTFPYEFALFGINTHGTNCDWRLPNGVPGNPAFAAPTNSDGVWFAIDAGYGSITPADFDAFTSPALPNAGVGDYQSSSSAQETGVFKSDPNNPSAPLPFVSEGATSPGLPPGGEPVNQWVNVSVEVSQGATTNVSVYMNRSLVIPSFNLVNGGGNYTSGEPMLGYLDPIANEANSSAFVYYSNVRVVELSPLLTGSPASVIATNGANVTFTSSATDASAPMTNVWYSVNASGVPTAPVLTNIVNATNMIGTLPLVNVQTANPLIGTNFMAVFSDAAGSITSAVVSLEVVGVTNVTALEGTTAILTVNTNGPVFPTSYLWYTNNVALKHTAHTGGFNTYQLSITNCQVSDAKTYAVAVTNATGGVIALATLNVIVPQTDITSVSVVGSNAVGNFTSTGPSDTTSSFILQSSVVVQGPYTNNPAAVFTGSSEKFQFTIPITTNATTFYRLMHK
jgi:hypothetical protein